ncbi:MAG: TrkH family potassium uptake protein [bacterium]|nr:TrkH family potassium uptake protein [bacterium]
MDDIKTSKLTVMKEKIIKFITKRWDISTTQMISFGFLATILIGSILLTLPIASANGQRTGYVDALFTATSATCVTGLTTVTTATHWSLFGKIVILILIQFGGLGIVTITTTVLLALRRRITLKERLLIQDAYNLDTLQGLVKLTIKILKGTFLIEGIGAVLYAIQFIPDYGVVKGAGMAVFTSISAFCNAGIDLIGDASLIPYQTNVLININTMLLIILGGIGFPVWWDIIHTGGEFRAGNIKRDRLLSKLELHTKLVLTTTIFLILSGAILTFAIEFDNPNTIGNMSMGNKVLASFFQSITTRTAGFATIAQENFEQGSSFLYLIFMFIGGSPSGTAGGIKTVTVIVLFLSLLSSIKNKQDVEAFHRRIPDNYVRKAITVTGISLFVLFTGTLLLCITEQADFLDIIYESTSAIATVGLTRGVTPQLTEIGKVIIIFTMYLGRIGPITLALAFNARKKDVCNSRKLPADKILVG